MMGEVRVEARVTIQNTLHTVLPKKNWRIHQDLDPVEEMIICIGDPCPQNPDKIAQGDSVPGAEVIAQWTKGFLEIQGTGTNEIIIQARSIPVQEMKETMTEHPLIWKEIRPPEEKEMIEIEVETEIGEGIEIDIEIYIGDGLEIDLDIELVIEMEMDM